MAVMTFNNEHIWCYKKYNNRWFRLDSLWKEPKPVEFRWVFRRLQFGCIIVWNTTKPLSHDHQSKKVTMNHPLKSVSKRSSKQTFIEEEKEEEEEEIVYEESNRPNRFEVLSIFK